VVRQAWREPHRGL